jgi:DNA-binding NarL/FixJ family response regulator
VINRALIPVSFTPREVQTLEVLVDTCASNREIGAQLGICERTVKQNMLHMNMKMNWGKGNNSRLKLAQYFRAEEELAPAGTLPKFTPRQLEILDCLHRGLSSLETATKLGIVVSTLRNMFNELFDKTGTWSRLELAAWVSARRRLLWPTSEKGIIA